MGRRYFGVWVVLGQRDDRIERVGLAVQAALGTVMAARSVPLRAARRGVDSSE